MDDLQLSAVKALDGRDERIFPFLPYLLQDLWELGASSKVVSSLVRKHDLFPAGEGGRVLDLGCGKGAISIPLAKEFDVQVHGIDAIPEFIGIARSKAKEYGVTDLSFFETGDMREAVKKAHGFDLAILGAVGPVLGDVRTTLKTLRPVLRTRGWVIIDDGYRKDGTELLEDESLTREEYHRQVRAGGFEFVDEVIFSYDEMAASNRTIQSMIEKRAEELTATHPDSAGLFQGYAQAQLEECDVLEHEVDCVTLLLRKA